MRSCSPSKNFSLLCATNDLGIIGATALSEVPGHSFVMTQPYRKVTVYLSLYYPFI